MKCQGCKIMTHKFDIPTFCKECIDYYLDDVNWDPNGGMMKLKKLKTKVRIK